RARGARVWHQYDGAIDVVAAADPLSTMGQEHADLPWPVAIESDGTEQYRSMSVRERSRLRPQLLERLGWRYMPLWTIEVFTDPSACADRIAGYLGLEKMALSGRATAAVAFLDDDVDQALNGIDAESQGGRERLAMAGAGQGDSGPAREGSPATPSTDPAPAEDQDSKEAGTMAQDHKEDSAPDAGQPAETESGQDQDGTPGTGPNSSALPAGPVVPNKASEDDPRAWGDREDDDHDAWLKEQKPPHWG
ncbi:MAG: AAA family ATPase, partial [Arthrobacter sp.]|nr:AAA family ATPase [Arthrobacter sp.]